MKEATTFAVQHGAIVNREKKIPFSTIVSSKRKQPVLEYHEHDAVSISSKMSVQNGSTQLFMIGMNILLFEF